MSKQESILIIDDEPVMLQLLEDILSKEDLRLQSANSGKLALKLVESDPPNLILLDINMPVMDGFEVCRRLKAQEKSRNIPIIFISGGGLYQDKVKGFALGAVDFIFKPFQQAELLARVCAHLELGRLRSGLEAQVLERTNELRKALGATIQAISRIVQTRDPYTAGHQRRVTDLARTLATSMGLDSHQINSVRMAGIVHDVGKVSIPAEILSKPTKLTDIEYSLIKTHPQAGYDIMKDLDFPWPIARIIYEHHERIDGSGYPNGLTGEKLLLESKILTVADVVEAMASHRPYRPALGIDVALDEILKNKSILYDPIVVEACRILFHEKGYCFT